MKSKGNKAANRTLFNDGYHAAYALEAKDHTPLQQKSFEMQNPSRPKPQSNKESLVVKQKTINEVD